MRVASLLVAAALLVPVALPAAAPAGPISDARQLTFEGKRAGEGYFSADGTKMIFQSERTEGNPFFQMYLFDLETGDVERLSTGVGKTTCGWLHPGGEKALFATTQFDPKAEEKMQAELEARESGQERRYSWDYDPTYEIVETDLKEGGYKKLTDARGYDAEGRLRARRRPDRVRVQPARLRPRSVRRGGRPARAPAVLLHGHLRHG
ncbi:MAG: hypothetical protein U5L06_08315 [Rhodovibrio sp.]|nr:hypothetical protein [Rhodovibrio sp.]